MINFPKILGPAGRNFVEQRLLHPAVYLDTWAIRLFAEGDASNRGRFRSALLRASGTLVISDLTLGEFASFDDARHASPNPFNSSAHEVQRLLRGAALSFECAPR